MRKWFAAVFVTLLLGTSLAENHETAVCLPAAPSEPTVESISREDAVLLAKQEMASRYKRSVIDFDRHKAKVNFVRLENGEDAWAVMVDHNNECYDVGEAVIISSKGDRIRNSVTNDEKELVEALLDQWKEQKGDLRSWSIEDKALFDWLYGSSEAYISPSEDYIGNGKAAEIALSAIPEDISSPEFFYSFKLLSDTDGKSAHYAWLITICMDGKEKCGVCFGC